MKRSLFFFFFPPRLPVNLCSAMIVCHVSFRAVTEFTPSLPRANLRHLRAGLWLLVGAGPRARPRAGSVCWANWVGLQLHQCKLGVGLLCCHGEKVFWRSVGRSSRVLSKLRWLRGEEGPQRATKVGWAPLLSLAGLGNCPDSATLSLARQ